MTPVSAPELWPTLEEPGQLKSVEAVPLSERGLPANVYAVLERRAQLTPERPAVTFLPSGERYLEGTTWTFGELANQVRAGANVLADLGVEPQAAVGLLSTNCSQLLVATLGAQTAAQAAQWHLMRSLGPVGVGRHRALVRGVPGVRRSAVIEQLAAYSFAVDVV